MKKFNKLFKTLFFSLLVFCSCFYFSNNFSYTKNSVSFATEQVSTSSSAKDKLNIHSQNLYAYLTEQIKSVAKGERSGTSFVISSETLSSWGVKTKWTASELGQSSITANQVQPLFFEQFSTQKLLSALLHDHPFDLYWFNKTDGITQQISTLSTSTYVNIDSLKITFDVSEEFRPSVYSPDNPTINVTKAEFALSALENAKQIVSDYESLNDYQKLNAYKNKICELVEYNDAAIQYPTPYGNPWQALYVFDNDSSTNVVCEGYAKAFQLLCNLSDFNSPYLKCYTVSGVMNGGTGAGGHMWNVVTMDDQQTYLVDITNSDTGTVGQSGTLFLTGTTTGTLSSGYTFNTPTPITFSYNSNTIDLWTNSSQSILNLNTRAYEANYPTITLTFDNDIVYDNENISAGLTTFPNVDIKFSFNSPDWKDSDYTWTFEWFSDNNTHLGEKLDEAPINGGHYWIKIIATNKTDTTIKYVHSQRFEIKPKQIYITAVSGEDRAYDGTKNVVITNSILGGVFAGDIVNIDYPFITAQITSANVGEYTTVNLSNIKLCGTHKNNYYIADATDVPTSTITISKAKPTCTETYSKITESGLHLSELQITITAKGVLDEDIEGTFIWTNSKGEAIEPKVVEISKDTTYYYVFTPTDSNYESTIVEVKLWESVEENNDKFFSKKNTVMILQISALCVVGLIAIAGIIKLQLRSKEH
jgi:hypothetical protein